MLAFKAGDIQMIYLIVGNLDLTRQINEGEVKGLLVPGVEAQSAHSRRAVVRRSRPVARPDSRSRPGSACSPPRARRRRSSTSSTRSSSAIVKTPDFAKQYPDARRASTPVGNSSEDFAKFLVEDKVKGKHAGRHLRRQAGAVTRPSNRVQHHGAELRTDHGLSAGRHRRELRRSATASSMRSASGSAWTRSIPASSSSSTSAPASRPFPPWRWCSAGRAA